MRDLKEANPNLKVLPASSFKAKSNKPNSFSENMKSQEQADFFMKMLNMLRQEEKQK